MGFIFSSPTLLDSGIGTVGKLGDYLKNYGSKKALIVTDKGIRAAGVLDSVTASLDASDIAYVIYDGVLPDPPDTVVEAAAALGKAEGVDSLVSVGGGSSMDAAKAALLEISLGRDFREFYGMPEITQPLLPHIAIPTTSGTGSEVSYGGIITNTETGRKQGIRSLALCPTVALLDGNMTTSLPKHITSATGMDALTHLMEACTTTVDSQISDSLCYGGIKTVYKYLPLVIEEPGNVEARQKLAEASAMASIAFNSTGLHIGHAFAHSLGNIWHIPHGVGCAWGLVYGIEHIADTVEDKIREFSKIFEVEGADTKPLETLTQDLKEAMLQFLAKVGIQRIGNFEKANREEFDKVLDACEMEMETLFKFRTRKPTSREYFEYVLEQSF